MFLSLNLLMHIYIDPIVVLSSNYIAPTIVDLEQNLKWLPLGLSNHIGVKNLVNSLICNIMQNLGHIP